MAELGMKLAAGRIVAQRAAPYYMHALFGLVPVIVETGKLGLGGQGTMAVTKDWVLIIEKGALERWTGQEIGAALVHEISHVLRRHHQRAGKREQKTVGIAMDMEINDDLPRMGLKLPKGYNNLPSDIQEPNGQTFEYYYEKMKQKGHGGASCMFCGSGAGQKPPNEEELIPPNTPRKTIAESTLIINAVANEIRKQAEHSPGTVPAGVKKWAEVAKKEKEIRWQDQLTRACRRAVSFVKGAIDTKYLRPSMRQAGLGYGVGKAILPCLVAPVPEVAILFDTSGSMDGDLTKEAAFETDQIMKALKARVTLCVVDAEVHALQKVGDLQSALRLLKGGGGTDFRPAFKALEEFKPRPNIIIAITDGYAYVPEFNPPGIRVIWCLVGKRPGRPAKWGDTILATKGASMHNEFDDDA